MALLITGDEILSFASHWDASSSIVQSSIQLCCGFDQIPRQTNPSRSTEASSVDTKGWPRAKSPAAENRSLRGSCSPHSLTPCALSPGLALGADAHSSLALNDCSSSIGLQKIEACVNMLYLLTKESIHNPPCPCTNLTKSSLFLKDKGQLLSLNVTKRGFIHFVVHI